MFRSRIARFALAPAAAVATLFSTACETTSKVETNSPQNLFTQGGNAFQSPAVPTPTPRPVRLDVPPSSQSPYSASQAHVQIEGKKAPSIVASSFLLLDAKSGATIASKQPDRQRAVASTQKLLTALLIVERGNLDGTITITRSDTLAPPSKMYLKAGQKYSRRELLSVFLVKSANDAADALARDHSGSVDAFAAAMNRKARQLGATQSHFVNPHGLTEPGQYSTARDIAKIAFVAYRKPFIREMARRQSVTVRGKRYDATNKLLKRMPECTGLKTGYTNAAGRCLVSTARIGGREVMLVQLGSKSKYIWGDAERMMRWGADQSRRYRPPAYASSAPVPARY